MDGKSRRADGCPQAGKRFYTPLPIPCEEGNAPEKIFSDRKRTKSLAKTSDKE